MFKKIMTVCIIYNDKQILLGQIKKEGVLKNRYNGFGGKLEEGETIEEAAQRELVEEAGIKALNMTARGEIIFEFEEEGNPFAGKPIVELHIFSASKYEGDIKETEEMKPQWFSFDKIPYENMWPDDKFWLPILLEGKNFKGKFYLKDPNTITKYELTETK